MNSSKILVVDDEPNIRALEQVCLEAAGYAVRLAGDGGEALVELTNDPPDLMLLDLAMPGLDGMTVLAEMHARWAHYPTRIIVVTAHGSVKVAIQAIRLGASDFLQKPFSPEDLRLSVASVLREGPPHFPIAGEGYLESLERIRRALCMRQFDLAERDLIRVGATTDHDVAYLNLAGVVHEAHGRAESAKKFYSQAVSRDYSYRPARENLARLDDLQRTGQTTRRVALGGDIADDQPQEFYTKSMNVEPNAPRTDWPN